MKPLFGQLLRFIVVGGVATAFQYVLLIAMVRSDALGPVAASGVSYVCSAALNYWLSHRFTFRSGQSHAVALPRFALVSGSGLLINQLVVGAAVHLGQLHYLVAQVAATLCVMAWNFVLGRLWTFAGGGRVERAV